MSTSGRRVWYRDPSLWTLIAANVVTIFLSLRERWEFATVLWVFFGQSLAIGAVGIMRILLGDSKGEYGYGVLDTFAGLVMNGASAVMFLLHYGAFHLIYAIVLRDFFGLPASEDRWWIVVGVGVFFIHHVASFFYHRFGKNAVYRQPMNAYARILPMHLSLLFFPVVRNAVVLFLLLRTGVDVLIHIFEHHEEQR